MRKQIIFAAALAALATGCGTPKAAIGVVNSLPVELIISVQTRTPGSDWSDNQLDRTLRPGVSESFTAPLGDIEVMATDNLGRTYMYSATPLTSEGVIWEITPEGRATAAQANSWAGNCPVTVTNDLGAWTITGILCSPSESSSWGESWITEPVAAGESVTFSVAPGTYDIRLTDIDGDLYTKWEVSVTASGFSWNATLEDLDASGG